jgi:thymidylate synthase
MYLMKPYDNALRQILDDGVSRTNKRTGIKTKSIFGMTCRYRVSGERFPILTKRKVWPKSVFSELLWFLSGSTSNKDLKELGCNFWTPWIDPEFEKNHGFAEETFGPVYGFQLRHFSGYYGAGVSDPFLENQNRLESPVLGVSDMGLRGGDCEYGKGGFDQLKWVVDRIKEDPSCRRTLWTLWNPQDVSKMRLPPCHMLFQVLVDDDRNMTGILYQRSADFPIGVPANIQFYSALVIMLAQQTDCKPFEFVHVTADSHVYEDQIPAVNEYLSRQQPPDSPVLEIKKASNIFSYKPEDFVISDYNPLEKIEIPVAV